MAVEIERKFLVSSGEWRAAPAVHIRQGYLCRASGAIVRVRVEGTSAYLTIKDAKPGMTRREFEYAIAVGDAEQLLTLCESAVIEKLRRVVINESTRWEVDEFLAENAGLVIAEVELGADDQPFSRPPWLSDEVTADPRYYNSNLAMHPYRKW